MGRTAPTTREKVTCIASCSCNWAMCHLANCKSIITSSQHCAPLSLLNDSQNERPTLSIDMPSGSNTCSVLDALHSHWNNRCKPNMLGV